MDIIVLGIWLIICVVVAMFETYDIIETIMLSLSAFILGAVTYGVFRVLFLIYT